MNELLAKTVPLALGAMVSPTLLTAAILVLSGKISPRGRSWAFVAGGAVALAAFTVLVPWLAGLLKSVGPDVIRSADVVFGVLLLAVALRKLSQAQGPGRRYRARTQARRNASAAPWGVLRIRRAHDRD